MCAIPKEHTHITLCVIRYARFLADDCSIYSIFLYLSLFRHKVLVFNCDEGIDVKSMGRIFVGLVKCGAWGCFDEFNRLEEGVLSAVSMQVSLSLCHT